MFAAAREIQEEVGVEVKLIDLELVHVVHVRKNESNTQDIIGFYFRAKAWQGQARNNEPHKIMDAQWFDLNALPENITEHALLAINGITTKNYYSEHGK